MRIPVTQPIQLISLRRIRDCRECNYQQFLQTKRPRSVHWPIVQCLVFVFIPPPFPPVFQETFDVKENAFLPARQVFSNARIIIRETSKSHATCLPSKLGTMTEANLFHSEKARDKGDACSMGSKSISLCCIILCFLPSLEDDRRRLERDQMVCGTGSSLFFRRKYTIRRYFSVSVN